MDANWNVKVADFNLSKVMETSNRSTSLAAMNPVGYSAMNLQLLIITLDVPHVYKCRQP